VQQLSLSIANKGGLEGVLTVVYWLNIQKQREAMWHDLNSLAATIQDMPWLVTGDFNTARFTSEET